MGEDIKSLCRKIVGLTNQFSDNLYNVFTDYDDEDDEIMEMLESFQKTYDKGIQEINELYNHFLELNK